MLIKSFKIDRDTFRKLDDPFENGKSRKYLFYAKVGDVPEGIPMATNPREQNRSSSVAKAISDSLTSNDGYFHLKNRGIVLSADSVIFNNKTGEVTIKFADSLYHGNIDGGHTYTIICDHKDDNLDQYVQFEVMTGVEDIIEDLARARNTSVQVDEKSMAELANKFDPIKEGIEGMPFYKRIAFKQNQVTVDEATNKKLKMIDAREVVAIINMFDINRFTPIAHPTTAYSSKATSLNQYLEDPDYFRAFVNIAPDIFDLYDAIETEFPEAYNSTGARYGRKKYSGYKDGKKVGTSKFGGHDLTYKVPDGIMYPIVAAFRALVVYNPETEKYEWANGKEPIQVWENCKETLATKLMSFANSSGDNPNSLGKDPVSYDLMYMTVNAQK